MVSTGGHPEQKSGGKRSFLRGGVLSAFGERDYTVLWAGALISNIGTWVQTAALLWLIKDVLRSNSWVGAVNMASFVPVLLFVPLAGSLADRHSRRTLIIAGQAVMMLGTLALGLAVSFGVASKSVILVTVSISGIAFALNFPAWQAILPDLVRPEDMVNAIALSAAQWNLARFLGPLIGAGILALFSPATAFYIDAVSFLLVIAALLWIHPQELELPPSKGAIRHDVLEGWKYVWERKWMVCLLVALTLVAFFGISYIVLIPAVARDVMGMGSTAYGFLLGMTGLGAVLGAPLLTWLGKRFEQRDIIKASALSLGLLLIAFGLLKIYWLSCVVSVGLGASFLVIGSASNSVLQANSERLMRGRVVGLYIMAYLGMYALGGEFMGYVADLVSTPFSLVLGGVVCVTVGLVLVAFPRLTHGAVMPAEAVEIIMPV